MRAFNKILSDLNRIRDTEMIENKIIIYSMIFRYFITSSSFRAIFFYRCINSSFSINFRILKYLIWLFSIIFCKVNIPQSAKVGGGLLMPHPDSIFINHRCIIGKNVTISQGVTIGGNIYKTKNGLVAPIIGDNVLIGAGAKVLGPVKVGKNSIIGANAVVVKDIPRDSVAVGVPAKVIKKIEKSFYDLSEEFKNNPQ